MTQLKYIVTGTGRCGTVYFAKFLTSLGIICGHETIFSYDGLEESCKRLATTTPLDVSLISKLASEGHSEKWFPDGITCIQADSSYMAAPFLSEDVAKDTKIIHLIRHPLEVINSFAYGLRYFQDDCLTDKYAKEYHKFIYQHVPMVLEYKNFIDRAAIYYIEWNKLIEKNAKNKPYLRHNIKRDVTDRLFSFLAVTKPNNYYSNVKSNHLQGLNKIITNFLQIPSLEVRTKLIEFYNNYFYIKI